MFKYPIAMDDSLSNLLTWARSHIKGGLRHLCSLHHWPPRLLGIATAIQIRLMLLMPTRLLRRDLDLFREWIAPPLPERRLPVIQKIFVCEDVIDHIQNTSASRAHPLPLRRNGTEMSLCLVLKPCPLPSLQA
jgi:hypothetical protein